MTDWTATQRLVMLTTVALLCYGVVWMQRVDIAHASAPVALCPNFDSVRVVRHHWIPERSRVIRTDPAPPCHAEDDK